MRNHPLRGGNGACRLLSPSFSFPVERLERKIIDVEKYACVSISTSDFGDLDRAAMDRTRF
jgi:hypothetical protein